jgi:hypothetical protein
LYAYLYAPIPHLTSFIYHNPYSVCTVAVAGSFQPAGNGKKISGEELAAYYSRGDLCKIFLENLDKMV